MTTTAKEPTAPAVEVEITARAYQLAHQGRLMCIARADDRARELGDFFEFETVGTHPTGLLVTGIFADGSRNHMRAAIIRDASPAEIAWRNSCQPS